jgi:ubiquinone/menaquinone biosynthesis C-methylase UbiE
LRAHAAITCVEASIERLPFDDGQFDTVVCTHTLEHVQHLQRAVDELRRVARRRLIVVVPRQRPYRYTFSLHVNFFPYAWSLTGQLGHAPGAVIKNLGDWFYLEDVAQPSDPRVVVGAVGQRYSPSGLPSISSSGSRVISSSAPSGS